ncbi:MAG TPA: hypothetical protein VHP11_02240 [Tepidisphaeraceae bacterium]|nr:hypothetical protein [Tepidisphaeraceae bacterium]
MTKRDKLIGGGVLAAAALFTVVLVWSRRPANNDDFPEGTFWLCANPKCQTSFTLTIKELGQHHEKHYGQPPFCPKCQGTDTLRAEQCPHCKKVYPLARDWGSVCPYCRKPTNKLPAT